MKASKQNRRLKIRKRIRNIVFGTSDFPRLSVFRSNKDIYAQLVDDQNGSTLISCSSREKEFIKDGNKVAIAQKVGEILASRAVEKGISKVKFDRNGYLYHGRIKSLADGAREGGLKF